MLKAKPLVLKNKMKGIFFFLFALVKSQPTKSLGDLKCRLKTYQNVTGIDDATYAQLWNKVLEHGMLGSLTQGLSYSLL